VEIIWRTRALNVRILSSYDLVCAVKYFRSSSMIKWAKNYFFSLVLSKTKNECWQKCFHLFSKSKPKGQRVLSSFDMYHRLPRNFVRTALYSVKLIWNSCRILKCILALRISFLVVLWIFDAHNLFKSLKLRYFYWQIINKHTSRRILENSDTMQNLENKTI